MNKQNPKLKNLTRYYDERNILDEITDESVDLILDGHLRDDILSGKRTRKLNNITIKRWHFFIASVKGRFQDI